MLERKGKLTAKVVKDTSSSTLTAEIIKTIKRTAELNTDEWLGYKGVSNIYKHTVVKHNEGEYVRGIAYTNNIEGFWALLKRGIYGIYHFASKKHLQIYIDEFVFRYNTRLQTETERFKNLLNNMAVRTTYRALVYGC